jgi:hypothetical protein
MTDPPTVNILDLTVIPPRPTDGKGGGAGIRMHLHLPDYKPSRRLRGHDSPLCGQFAYTKDKRPLAWLIDNQVDTWRWCRSCIGHLVEVLDRPHWVIQWVFIAQDTARSVESAAKASDAQPATYPERPGPMNNVIICEGGLT